MKKNKKEMSGHELHSKHNHSQKPDPFKTENHKEYVKFLKDIYGGSIYKSDRLEKEFESGAGPYFPPVDILFNSDKSENKIKENFDRSCELTKRNFGKWIDGMTRRNFLKTIGLASLAVAGSSCQFIPEWEYAGIDTYVQKNAQVPGPSEEAKVAVVQGDTIENMVRAAIESAGGLDLIKEGETVIIKPNCVWFSGEQTVPSEEKTAHVTTNPEVLRAVIRAVKERTAPGNIYVSDHSAIFISTMFVMQQQGIYDVCMEEGVIPFPMEDWPHIYFSSDKFLYLDEPFIIAKPLYEADHLINVPVLKNHNMPLIRDMPQYTCCIKAFVGLMAPCNRMFTERLFHLYNLPEKVAELDLCRPWRRDNGKPGITMNVVDATQIMVSGGPQNSQFLEEMISAHPNMIIASPDRIACDSAAVSVLKYYGALKGIQKDYIKTPVWEQRQIVHAGHLGLGVNDRKRIEIEFQGVEEKQKNAIMNYWNEG